MPCLHLLQLNNNTTLIVKITVTEISADTVGLIELNVEKQKKRLLTKLKKIAN